MKPAVIILFIVCLAITGCGNENSAESGQLEEYKALFEKIEVGMSRQEVCKIMGEKYDAKKKESDHTYFSEDKKVSIIVFYKDDKVSSKMLN